MTFFDILLSYALFVGALILGAFVIDLLFNSLSAVFDNKKKK